MTTTTTGAGDDTSRLAVRLVAEIEGWRGRLDVSSSGRGRGVGSGLGVNFGRGLGSFWW